MQPRIRPAKGYGPQTNAEVNEQVEGMLQALGARVMNALRTGGEKFLDFDEKYAHSAGRFGDDSNVAKAMRGAPIRDLIGNHQQHGPGFYGNGAAFDIPMNGMLYGGTAANLLSRYALPAGGVTLAGKGLYDIAAGLSQPEEEVIM